MGTSYGDFNPRSREGSDNGTIDGALRTRRFQSTLPRGERRFCSVFISNGSDFNPRSREGSDSDGRIACYVHEISIHAPARGATAIPFAISRHKSISIHAPARGATYCTSCRSEIVSNFNPRSREGSDDFIRSFVPLSRHFNPRSREGSDVAGLSTYINQIVFQSTLPRGERPRCLTRQ